MSFVVHARHQQSHRLSLGLGFRVAEDNLRALVPIHDVPGAVGRDDRGLGRLCESPIACLALTQSLVGDLQFRRALGHASLHCGVREAQFGFCLFPARDFALQFPIGTFELAMRGDGKDFRHDCPQRYCRHDRNGRGERFESCIGPVIRVPDIPETKEVRRAARQHEGAEQPEHRRHREVTTLLDHVPQRDRNRKIRCRNEGIRQHVGPQQGRRPREAIAVRHETARGNGIEKRVEHSDSLVFAPLSEESGINRRSAPSYGIGGSTANGCLQSDRCRSTVCSLPGQRCIR